MTDFDTLGSREQNAQRLIDWVIEHSRVSDWLKDALRAALTRDPVQVLTEAEMLRELLRLRSEAAVLRTFQQFDPTDQGDRPRPE